MLLSASENPFRVMVIAVFAFCLHCGCANDAPEGGGEFDSAFMDSGISWRDSETGRLKSSAAPSRPDSSVANRGRIPPKPPPAGKAVRRQSSAAPVAAATGGAGNSSIGNAFIYIGGGLLVAVLIGLLIYGFLKLESNDGDADAEARKKNRRKINDHIRQLPFEIEEQEGDFETVAEKALREGDYNRAVIYLFADFLVAMGEAGIIRLQRGKTNRQYLNNIWDYNSIRPYYQKLMIAFEDAFFGKHQISQARANDCFAERERIELRLEEIRSASYSTADSPASSSTAVAMEPGS